MEKQDQFSQEKVTLRVNEVAKILDISLGTAYGAIQRGEIPSIRIGRRVLIPRKALDRLLDSVIKDRQD
ncbi:helix-turn-helix domain-containing protein [Chloroflexota bacterium]